MQPDPRAQAEERGGALFRAGATASATGGDLAKELVTLARISMKPGDASKCRAMLATLERALEGEFTEHLGYEKHATEGRRRLA